MKRFTEWLKGLFSKKTTDAVISAAQSTADFLAAHEAEFAQARELVAFAEAEFPTRDAGELKREYVARVMADAWRALKPHMIDILVGIAVQLMKGARS